MGSPTPGVFVVSAPSGTGKTTLNRRLVQEHPTIALSVSYTARTKRAQEVEGEHYHFVTKDQFQQHIAGGEMLEWAEVFGNLYGTSMKELERIKGLGKSVLLEIDVQGWQTAKPKLPGAVAIFVLPPSIEVLWQRLAGRATESKLIRYKRLTTAATELNSAALYDYFIVNRDLDVAYKELADIIIHGKPGKTPKDKGIVLCNKLIDEYENAKWIRNLRDEME
jgi:guanylate kinase